MAKRHSIDTIAEVLIDKLKDLEITAKRIEIASNKELKIDTSELKGIIQNQMSEERHILNELKLIQEQNKARAPNWVWYLATVIFILSFACFMVAFKYNKLYHIEKHRADTLEQTYNV